MNELVDIVASLVMIMNEETERLQQPGRFKDHGELTVAKLRLVSSMEQRLALLARSGSGWLDAIDRSERDSLLTALERLRVASDANSYVLARQIDLSTELMNIVATEAQRLTGKRSASYCELGHLTAAEVSAPISVNASL